MAVDVVDQGKCKSDGDADIGKKRGKLKRYIPPSDRMTRLMAKQTSHSNQSYCCGSFGTWGVSISVTLSLSHLKDMIRHHDIKLLVILEPKVVHSELPSFAFKVGFLLWASWWRWKFTYLGYVERWVTLVANVYFFAIYHLIHTYTTWSSRSGLLHLC